MRRDEYNWQRFTDFRGGINRNVEDAGLNQVLDARNVWVRNGLLQTRPGFRALTYATFGFGDAGLDYGLVISKQEGSVFTSVLQGAFGNTLSLAGLEANTNRNDPAANHYYYVGYRESEIGSVLSLFSSSIVFAEGNTNDVGVRVTYWNGKRWAPFPFWRRQQNIIGPGSEEEAFHGAPLSSSYMDAMGPADWALTTVDGYERYFLRFELIERGASSFSAGAEIDNFVGAPNYRFFNSGSIFKNNVLLAQRVQWSTQRKLLAVQFDVSSRRTRILSRDDFRVDGSFIQYIEDDERIVEDASLVTLPFFDTTYICAGHRVYEVNRTTQQNDDLIAKVNQDQEFLDFNWPGVTLLTEFPRANQLVYHKGVLFAFDLLDEPFTFRYSGPVFEGSYNVWPTVAVETLAESDNSKIVGGYSWDEQLIVGKGDSIWRIVEDGFIPGTSILRWRTVLMVRNTGWVSQDAVTSTPAGLFFASEDGFYIYQGGNSAQLISAPIEELYQKINPSKLKNMTAIYWPEEQVVLCAAALGASDVNNTVFVWDIRANAWWVWDNLEVVSWLLDEDSSDRTQIRFCDSRGRIFDLGGTTDNGAAIDDWLLTHRFPPEGLLTQTLRAVEVVGHNSLRNIKVKPIIQDVPQEEFTLLYTDDTDVLDGAPDGATVWPERIQPALTDYAHNGRWAQLRISNGTKAPMKLYGYKLGFYPQGVRG